MNTAWDLSLLGFSESDIERELEEVRTAHGTFIAGWKERGEWLEDPVNLCEALDAYASLMGKYGYSGRVGYYYRLLYSLHQGDAVVKGKLQQVEEVERELQSSLSFFYLGLSKVASEKQTLFLADSRLEKYRSFLANTFEWGKHTLSESEEKILTVTEGVRQDAWERMTAGLLSSQKRVIEIEGREEEKSFSELLNLCEDGEKELRDRAGALVQEILDRYSGVGEAELNAVVLNKKISDELRGFDRPDASRHLDDAVSTEMVDSLLEAVEKRFSIAQRYYALKARLMGVSKLAYYERNCSYGSLPLYSFEEAARIVSTVFRSLDGEFGDIFDSFLRGKIDVFPYQGKRQGAFCTHNVKGQPVYILLNFEGTLRDATVLAHEVGHGIHAVLKLREQHGLAIDTPKSTAEVASTFFEDFVHRVLLDGVSDEMKLAILMDKVGGDVATIFRQVAFYRFEQALHSAIRKEGYISAERIGVLFKEEMSRYMGEGVSVAEAGNWWLYVPHFRYFFYVYSYASGLLISKALQEKVKADPAFIQQFKAFLTAGSSLSPEQLFSGMGIDVSKEVTWNEGLDSVERAVDECIVLAKKLRRI
ncbi:MAG TPA: M3 family oligoendopeptidase [Candidatus Nanoarchaeia archaeon]|nr:M3 family oligoendopeptidase [Candidatus Nanoarchaeia archaeon]